MNFTYYKGKNFHISWNPMVGETALVNSNGTKFYILMGNYLEEYKDEVPKGYRACKKLYDSMVKKGAKVSFWSN